MCKQYFVLVYGNIIFHSTGMKQNCFIFYLRYLHYLEIVEEGRVGVLCIVQLMWNRIRSNPHNGRPPGRIRKQKSLPVRKFKKYENFRFIVSKVILWKVTESVKTKQKSNIFYVNFVFHANFLLPGSASVSGSSWRLMWIQDPDPHYITSMIFRLIL